MKSWDLCSFGGKAGVARRLSFHSIYTQKSDTIT